MSLSKQLKTEMFFWKEMLRYGYWHPKYWQRYFKNKFIYHRLIDKIEAVTYQPDPDFELHTLICKKDIWMLIWSLKSFLFFSGLNPRIVLHDDGTLDDKSIETIERIFPMANILKRAEAEQKLNSIPEYKGIIKKFREQGHIMTIKLVDVLFLSSGKYVMTLDSDILFFNTPQLIIDFIRGRLSYDAMISGIPGQGGFQIAVEPSYTEKNSLDSSRLSSMNAGLVILRKDALSYAKLMEYFENVKLPPEDYFVEMTGWCCLVGQMNYLLLPPDLYILKGKVGSQTIMKHFTSPRRHEMFAYGIDLVKLKMKNGE